MSRAIDLGGIKPERGDLSQIVSTNLPPYLPYKTFIGFVDSLKVGMPSHVDRSVIGSMSGTMQSWLLASLRAMRLIDTHGVPTAGLIGLVKADGPERKEVLAALFHHIYDFLPKSGIDLKTATPSKVMSAFSELGAKGETVEKCIAFMKAMAKDAGVEMSVYLTKRASRQRTAVRRKSADQPEDVREDADDAEPYPESNAMKTIELPGAGGSLTLSGSFNVFDLVGEERDLVFGIIDLMNKFQSSRKEGQPDD